MNTTTHCPHCGTTMQPLVVEGRTREVCPACHHIFYRNPVPAAGVILPIDDGIVLVRRKYEPRVNFWCLPAGYMELGERTEDAAVRECKEETGLQVRAESLLGVYSFGSGMNSGLIIVYVAQAVGGRLEAGDDAAEVGIFPPDQLPSPLAFCTHVQAIEDWRRSMHQPITRTNGLYQPVEQNDVLIRPARHEDAEPVLRLLTALVGYDSHNDQAVLTQALFHQRVRDADSPILVAEHGGELAGFVGVTFRRALTGWRAAIDDLVVAPDCRRRRVGQSLVQTVVSLAATRSCSTVHIDSVHLSEAHEVQSFYQACGFAHGNVATMQIS